MQWEGRQSLTYAAGLRSTFCLRSCRRMEKREEMPAVLVVLWSVGLEV